MLCDTNIISELSRHQPNSGVLAWAESVTHIHLSVVSIEEIHFGLAWKDNARIRAWFEDFLRDYCTILPITPEIARLAGEMRGNLQRYGRPREQADMLIAATAAVHGLPLITRNAKDFSDCNISVINPFT